MRHLDRAELSGERHCFHFNIEPHNSERPENEKVKYPQFVNSRLRLIECFIKILEDATTLMPPPQFALNRECTINCFSSLFRMHHSLF